MKSMKDGAPPPKRTAADNATVDAYRDFQKRAGDYPFPAGEIRAMYEVQGDGVVGKNRTPPHVSRAIDAGSIPKDYRGITVPVLALFAAPQPPAEKWKGRVPKNAQERIDSDRTDEILLEYFHRWQDNLRRAVPSARIVEVPGGHHYLFQDEEDYVLREIRAFFKSL